MSALNVTLSVSASPIVILPFAVIFPVAVMFPYTFVLPCTSKMPVPFGTNSMLALESFVELTLLVISIESIVKRLL